MGEVEEKEKHTARLYSVVFFNGWRKKGRKMRKKRKVDIEREKYWLIRFREGREGTCTTNSTNSIAVCC